MDMSNFREELECLALRKRIFFSFIKSLLQIRMHKHTHTRTHVSIHICMCVQRQFRREEFECLAQRQGSLWPRYCYTYRNTNTHTHTRTHMSIYIYLYIYSYMYVNQQFCREEFECPAQCKRSLGLRCCYKYRHTIHTHTHICEYTYIYIYIYVCCCTSAILPRRIRVSGTTSRKTLIKMLL